ncbi:MAG: tyrosine-type recombinase/integrase [Syntrophales bacterium LBB04]|nr:tyrosine-type recombinase/integrase [Syntrophales bacterium LBB04]
MSKWIKTKFPGVRYYKHPTRKHGVKFGQYFSIRYQRDGKRIEEGLGWASDKKEQWTEEKAALKLAELISAFDLGKKEPTRLSEARQAEKERKELEAKEKARQEKDALTFGEFFKKTYYPIAERSKKPGSYKTEWGHFQNWIEPAIGAIPLKDLRPIHLERLKKTLQEANKSARTIQYIFATVRGCWNTARKHRITEGDSPTKAVKKPKVENKRVRYLTTEEAQSLLEELKSRDLATYRMAFISLFTGLRAKEIFSLNWKNLDREKGLLWVMDGKGTKSRPVYIPDQVKDLFQKMTPGDPEDLIFPGPKGKVFPQIPRLFEKIVKKLGFNEGITDRREKFTFHNLRHTAASYLIQNGVDLYTVKEILGHSTIQLTERYSHLADQTLKEAAQKMPDLTRDQAAPGKVVTLKK